MPVVFYYVVDGITGQKSANLDELKKSVEFIKKHTNLPILPGFGIKNPVDVNNICKVAYGVVGSSIIKIVEDNLDDRDNMILQIDTFTKQLKEGTKMNWLTNFVKPKLSSLVKRKAVPEKLWNPC